MFLLPFITVLREGLEAVVFIGGVGLSLPATSFPLAVVCGLGAGIFVGYLIYRLVNVAEAFETTHANDHTAEGQQANFRSS